MRIGNNYVDRMATMRFEGLKIDHRWLGHPWLCRGGTRVEEGRATGFWFAAAYVLAEICYFYSPAVERDPEGHIVTVRKRFKHDLMWQDYGVWAAKIGLSKGQLQDIIAFLVQRGLIGREVRPVPLDNGMQTNNQPHIWPVPEKIYELTYGHSEGSETPGQDTPPLPTAPAEQPAQPAPKRLPKNRDIPGARLKKAQAPPEKSGHPSPVSEAPLPQKEGTIQYVHTGVPQQNVHHQQPPPAHFSTSGTVENVAVGGGKIDGVEAGGVEAGSVEAGSVEAGGIKGKRGNDLEASTEPVLRALIGAQVTADVARQLVTLPEQSPEMCRAWLGYAHRQSNLTNAPGLIATKVRAAVWPPGYVSEAQRCAVVAQEQNRITAQRSAAEEAARHEQKTRLLREQEIEELDQLWNTLEARARQQLETEAINRLGFSGQTGRVQQGALLAMRRNVMREMLAQHSWPSTPGPALLALAKTKSPKGMCAPNDVARRITVFKVLEKGFELLPV